MIITQHWLWVTMTGGSQKIVVYTLTQQNRPEDALWYLIGKRRLDDAQKKIDELQKRNVDNAQIRSYRAILFALKGNFQSAESEIPGILEKAARSEPELSPRHI